MKLPYAVLILVLVTACDHMSSEPPANNLSGAELANIYCGSCHLFPNPSLLTKEKWQSVLPRMAPRLGIPTPDFDPYGNLSGDAMLRMQNSGIFPQQQILSDTAWEKIKAFYLAQAPDTLALPPRQLQENTSSLFTSQLPVLELGTSPYVSMVKFDNANNLFLATWNGEFLQLDSALTIKKRVKFPRPMIDFNRDTQGDIVALSIGDLYPNDELYGAMAMLDDRFTPPRLLFADLPRPVNFAIADLDDDGWEDLVICSFGNYLGKLSWFRNTGNGYEEHIIKEVPGATRVYAQDLDDDSDIDLAVLFAQGDESVSFFYNEGGSFREEQVLRFHPLYGSNDFEFIDFDQDGDRDIVLSNGDNGDFSNILKPYHGIRIFLNEQNKFSERYFYPLFGASKVRARDFDLDGDIDIVAASFFPDTENGLDQSIIYLEQTDTWQFKASHIAQADRGRWMVMDAGDLDHDGDDDVVLGSFTLESPGVDVRVFQRWRNSRDHILILRNNTIATEQ